MAGDAAEDLVQETLIRAWTARHRYAVGSNGRAWLCRILCNLAISEKRRQSRDERLRARVLAEAPVSHAADSPAQLLDRSTVRAALAALLPSERRILELAELEDLSYREIARTLECPIGTVMSRLHRARRHLRQQAAASRASGGEMATRHAVA